MVPTREADMATRSSPPGPEQLVGQALESVNALLRLPALAVRTAEAVVELPGQLADLQRLVERTVSSMESTGQSIELAAKGIRGAISGVERVISMLDGSLPALVTSAGSLSQLGDSLGKVAGEMAKELPNAVISLQSISPEMSKVASILDGRLNHLDVVVSELNSTIGAIIGVIPGVRRVLKNNNEPSN
jgi:methyl-accepting chemotaxis protein